MVICCSSFKMEMVIYSRDEGMYITTRVWYSLFRISQGDKRRDDWEIITYIHVGNKDLYGAQISHCMVEKLVAHGSDTFPRCADQ